MPAATPDGFAPRVLRDHALVADGHREALALPSSPTTAVLLRRLEAGEGDCQVDVRVELSGDYGRAPATVEHVGEGIYTGRTGSVHRRLSGARAARRPGEDRAPVPGRRQGARADARGSACA